MSPIQAMERSYSAVKDMLREGRYPPGARLEANRLADELGVSMTPIRDVLHRLVGERLVEASAGDGFHVPRHSEAELRDLYEWHSALILIALRTAHACPEPVTDEQLAEETLAGRTALIFGRIAELAPNGEIAAAIAAVADRLHPFRIAERDVLDPVAGELEELVVPGAGLPQAVRRYHLRRMKAVPALLVRRTARSSTRI